MACTRFAPAYLLLLDHTLAYHLIDGRLDERRGNQLPVPVPIAVVGDVRTIDRDIPLQLAQPLQQIPAALPRLRQELDIGLKILEDLQRARRIPVDIRKNSIRWAFRADKLPRLLVATLPMACGPRPNLKRGSPRVYATG